MPRKLIYVEWLDAKSEADKGWKSLEDLSHEPVLCHSIGWVIGETDLAITLASSLIFDQDDYDGDVTIPKSWIANMKELKCARFKVKKPKQETKAKNGQLNTAE